MGGKCFLEIPLLYFHTVASNKNQEETDTEKCSCSFRPGPAPQPMPVNTGTAACWTKLAAHGPAWFLLLILHIKINYLTLGTLPLREQPRDHVAGLAAASLQRVQLKILLNREACFGEGEGQCITYCVFLLFQILHQSLQLLLPLPPHPLILWGVQHNIRWVKLTTCRATGSGFSYCISSPLHYQVLVSKMSAKLSNTKWVQLSSWSMDLNHITKIPRLSWTI